jgi:hypothetical protein
MNQDYPNFQSRIRRINRSRRNRVVGEFVLQSDGLLVPKQRRLRFGFPFRGLFAAFVIAIAVKAYLIWFLGIDLYRAEVLELLSGSSFEQVAARIMMPDQLTMWVVGVYDWLALQYVELTTTAGPAAADAVEG